jgi:hypothetical protein
LKKKKAKSAVFHIPSFYTYNGQERRRQKEKHVARETPEDKEKDPINKKIKIQRERRDQIEG